MPKEVRGAFESVVVAVIIHPHYCKVLTVKMKPSSQLREDLRSQLSKNEERHLPGGGVKKTEHYDLAIYNRIQEKLGVNITLLERLLIKSREDFIPEEEGGGTRSVMTFWYIATISEKELDKLAVISSSNNDIAEGSIQWTSPDELVHHESEYGLCGVSWDRTPFSDIWRALNVHFAERNKQSISAG